MGNFTHLFCHANLTDRILLTVPPNSVDVTCHRVSQRCLYWIYSFINLFNNI